NAELDPPQHGLYIGPIHDCIGELLKTRLALDEEDRHTELHAELRLQLVSRAMMDERIGHVVVGPHGDALYPLGTQIVSPNKVEHDAHAGMGQRAAGMRLDGYTWKRECPRIA